MLGGQEPELRGSVGLDIVFPESEPVSAGDDALLALAQRHPLVFAQVFDFSAPERACHSGALSGATVLAADDAWRCHAPVGSGFIGNFFTAQQQPCTGHVTPSPDPDREVRSIAPFIRRERALYPMLAPQMICCITLAPDAPFQTLAPGAEARSDAFINLDLRYTCTSYSTSYPRSAACVPSISPTPVAI